MKRFSLGLIIGIFVGCLLVGTVSFAVADSSIKLLINGKYVQCDVPPQNINGRVLVPARFVAEALGETVSWDDANQTVIINEANKTLPASLDKTELITKVKEAYNSQDAEQLYNIFGERAKQQISTDSIKKAFEKLTPMLGKLNEAKFNKYEYLGNQEGLDCFKLTYDGIYDEGNGEIFVTIIVDNDGKWEVESCFFNLNYSE